jgi:cobalt-zinc-cadmium resistance protein CzcA
VDLVKSEYAITVKEITAQVRSAYFFWLYLYDKLNVLNEQKNLYHDLVRTAGLRYNLGETDLLEKTVADTRYAEVNNEYSRAQDDLVIAQNKLKQLICTDEDIYPDTLEYGKYSIIMSADTSRYSTNVLTGFYEKSYLWQKSKLDYERSLYFPGIMAGYFNQNIGPLKGLDGWHIGLYFPLWFLPRNARIKSAKIQTQIAENEWKYQKFNIEKDIENLQLQLSKYSRQLRYYNENALKQADVLISTAKLQFEKENIEYYEYIQNISTALKIKLDYLQTFDNYNQTAIQLGFYLN